MQAGRSETAQMPYLMHLLEFHPRISIGRSHFISRFPACTPGAGPRLPRTFQRQRDTYQKVGVAGLVGTHRKLLNRTEFRRRSPRRPKSGRPDQQFGLAINAIRELYPLRPPANKSQREIARQAVAEAHSRYGASISLRSAQRAVDWVSKRRSARK
jgi:hypothetical protein